VKGRKEKLPLSNVVWGGDLKLYLSGGPKERKGKITAVLTGFHGGKRVGQRYFRTRQYMLAVKSRKQGYREKEDQNAERAVIHMVKGGGRGGT